MILLLKNKGPNVYHCVKIEIQRGWALVNPVGGLISAPIALVTQTL